MKRKAQYFVPDTDWIPVQTEECIAMSGTLEDLEKHIIYEEDFA